MQCVGVMTIYSSQSSIFAWGPLPQRRETNMNCNNTDSTSKKRPCEQVESSDVIKLDFEKKIKALKTEHKAAITKAEEKAAKDKAEAEEKALKDMKDLSSAMKQKYEKDIKEIITKHQEDMEVLKTRFKEEKISCWASVHMQNCEWHDLCYVCGLQNEWRWGLCEDCFDTAMEEHERAVCSKFINKHWPGYEEDRSWFGPWYPDSKKSEWWCQRMPRCHRPLKCHDDVEYELKKLDLYVKELKTECAEEMEALKTSQKKEKEGWLATWNAFCDKYERCKTSHLCCGELDDPVNEWRLCKGGCEYSAFREFIEKHGYKEKALKGVLDKESEESQKAAFKKFIEKHGYEQKACEEFIENNMKDMIPDFS